MDGSDDILLGSYQAGSSCSYQDSRSYTGVSYPQTAHLGLQLLGQNNQHQQQFLFQHQNNWATQQLNFEQQLLSQIQYSSQNREQHVVQTCPRFSNNFPARDLDISDSTQILYPKDNPNNSRVRFSTMLSVYCSTENLLGILDWCFYSKSELVSFKSERKAIIRKLRAVKFDASQIDTSEHDLRGLEAYRSPSFNTLMQRKRKEVIQSVLDEQRRQRCNGTHNPERIRTASKSASAWAIARAVELGINDAIEVGCPPSPRVVSNKDNNETSPMDIDDASTSLPSLSGLSSDSISSTSDGNDDVSWAEKLMGEDLIPDL